MHLKNFKKMSAAHARMSSNQLNLIKIPNAIFFTRIEKNECLRLKWAATFKRTVRKNRTDFVKLIEV